MPHRRCCSIPRSQRTPADRNPARGSFLCTRAHNRIRQTSPERMCAMPTFSYSVAALRPCSARYVQNSNLHCGKKKKIGVGNRLEDKEYKNHTSGDLGKRRIAESAGVLQQKGQQKGILRAMLGKVYSRSFGYCAQEGNSSGGQGSQSATRARCARKTPMASLGIARNKGKSASWSLCTGNKSGPPSAARAQSLHTPELLVVVENKQGLPVRENDPLVDVLLLVQLQGIALFPSCVPRCVCASR